ncbi:MAG TPA: 4-hydroxy-3-methylbut-2-enyl diphosphate reductase [Acidimicrobiales bacterium]
MSGGRRVLLAGPRSFCAGVERAIDTVERALERFGPPVYVRKQIVHNSHVVNALEQRGAVFVDELSQVPVAATVVLSAHGVSPEVRAEAGQRDLRVIDATCPLVNKVHVEARRFAQEGYRIVLVGHLGHEEIEGTLGEAPGRIDVVDSTEAVDRLAIDADQPVAYLAQTTLATDEVAEIVDALRGRFPRAVGPGTDDICYATQNRQDAVRKIARRSDVVIVVGSANSSNSNRLVEVAEREGCEAHLIDDPTELDASWISHAATVGVTAGASAPETLVGEVVAALGGLGPLELEEDAVTTERVRFRAPDGVR